MKGDALDPKALIREAYRIEGITIGECRSVFLDWALSLADGQDSRAGVTALLDRYQKDHPAHPMTQVLIEGQQTAASPRRRGGWRSRSRHS